LGQGGDQAPGIATNAATLFQRCGIINSNFQRFAIRDQPDCGLEKLITIPGRSIGG
jgi:hypothetical protein